MSVDAIDAKEKDYLYLAPSLIPSAGLGLFVSIPIYKDEVICLFKGEILGADEAANRAKKGEDGYFINQLDGLILDSMFTDCFAKYANDPLAFGPNIAKSKYKVNAEISLDYDDNICLIAKRNIKVGEEVFCSYGKKYWVNFNSK